MEAVQDSPAEGAAGEGAAPVGETVMPTVDEITVKGQMGLFNMGGKKPTSSSLRLTGGKVAVVGNKGFQKGTIVRGTFEAVIYDVGQVDKNDANTGTTVSCEQQHRARITDLTIEGT